MSRRMDRRWFWRVFFMLPGLFLVLQFAGGPSHAAPVQTTSVSIHMSNPACVQVVSTSGACSIQVNSLSASGSDQTFSRLEVLVNGKLRAYMGGFFESTAYLGEPMLSSGLGVACGRPGDGGLPNYGKAYLFTANAYMADGTSSSASATVYCPAYEAKIYLPMTRR